jgi:hypothetical protein
MPTTVVFNRLFGDPDDAPPQPDAEVFELPFGDQGVDEAR